MTEGRKRRDFYCLILKKNRSSICDGIIDCRNGLDEQCEQINPLIVCSVNEYHCPLTHRCIPNAWKCNGINDCLDLFASDELGRHVLLIRKKKKNTYTFFSI